MASSFIYTIATDIIAAKLDEGRLKREVAADPLITIALLNVARTDGDFTVSFKADLPAADKTALDGDISGPAGGLIGPHSGELLNPCLHSIGAQLTVAPAATVTDDTTLTEDMDYQGVIVAVEARGAGDKLTLEVVHPGTPDTILATILDTFIPADGLLTAAPDAMRLSIVSGDLLRCRYVAAAGGASRTVTVDYRAWA